MVTTNRYPYNGPECPRCGAALDKAVDPVQLSRIWHCWVCGFSEPRDEFSMENVAKMAGLKGCDSQT